MRIFEIKKEKNINNNNAEEEEEVEVTLASFVKGEGFVE